MAWKIGSKTNQLKADGSDSYNKEADIIKTKSSNLNGILNSIITSKGYYYHNSSNRNVNYYSYNKNKIHPNPSIINDLAYGNTSAFGISNVYNAKDKVVAVVKKKEKLVEEKGPSGACCCCPSIPLVAKKRNHEIAIVACGCFWNPQQRIQKVTKHELAFCLCGSDLQL